MSAEPLKPDLTPSADDATAGHSLASVPVSANTAATKPRAQWWSLLIGTAATAIAVWVLYSLRESVQTDQILGAVRSIAFWKLAASALATAVSFLILACMEWLGARHYLQSKIEFRKTALFSFIVYGISNTFGFAGLASTPLRLKLYGDDKAPADRVLSLCILASISFWFGLALLLGISMIASGLSNGHELPLSRGWLIAGGALLLAGGTFGAWFISGRGADFFGKFHLDLPDFKQILLQSSLAGLDWFFAGLALFVLLPSSLEGNIFVFMTGFLLSQVAALVSSVPGGIGVLEGFSVLLMKAPKSELPALGAAFIAYRGLYYLPPLIGSFFLFLGWSLKRTKSSVAHATLAVATLGRSSAPLITSIATGLFGLALLLNSGQAIAWVTETSAVSTFWESLIGTGLLILALGLYERSSSAAKITMIAMILIIAGESFHQEGWTPVVIASGLLMSLLISRKEFYRESALTVVRDRQRFSALVVLPTMASMILAIVAFYRHEIEHQQWWKFTLNPNESAILRGCVGSLVMLGAFGLWACLAPRVRPIGKRRHADATPESIEKDLESIRSSPFTTACLALVGDKDLFRSEGIEGFIMYKVTRPYWVAMGEPVCAPEQTRALVSAFLEACDRHGGVPVFYQTRPETLANYVEVGFQAIKIGEEARVSLPSFSLEGRKQKSMRNTCSRIERDGYKFGLLSKEVIPAHMSELKTVSDEWLNSLSMREKAFSIGYFKNDYLSQNDVAVVTKDGRIIAFANVWTTGSKMEYSVDLMRYSNAAPSGVMEYLIIQLMLHAKAEGYGWFNLGMAPLAGLEGIHSGRGWHRVGSVIYRAGEAFYNFRGLKAFKDKFGPVWEPRFLVYPPGSNLARILSSVMVLINFRSAKAAQEHKRAS